MNTLPPPEPGRHGIAELLTLVGEIRRLAFGTLPPVEALAGSETRSASTTAHDPHTTTARTLLPGCGPFAASSTWEA
jgi:hypothetical protein